MATSNAMNTSNDKIKYTISVTQNSQNITNNTSNVTVKVRFYRTNTGYTTYGTGTVYCKINGTKYSASVTSSQKITDSGIVLFTKTLDITHNSDGSKTLTCSAWIDHQQVTSNEQSYSQMLTTIPRKSTLTVGNGTLGTAQTLSITRNSSSFTHTISYTCGSASGTITSKTTGTSISFTPPMSLASQNTSGTTVSIKYTITTYNGTTSLGSNSYTKTCSIPASVKPSCSLSVSDGNEKSAAYGEYIQGISTFKVNVTGTTSYGASISSYSTTANGKTYTTRSFTTGVITSSGSNSITATVTDKRGRKGSFTSKITVLPYSAPIITKMSAVRCNSDGTENDQGDHIKVVFRYKAYPLNNKNVMNAVQVKYKKTSSTIYTAINDETDYTSIYEPTGDITYIFAAATGSSYNVQVYVKDAFKSTTHTTSVSTGFTLMHWKANGKGMAIGKISEKDDTLEVGMKMWSKYGHLINSPVSISSGTDLDSIKDLGYYIIPNTTISQNVTNKPALSTTATAIVEVLSGGDSGQVIQRFTQCDKDDQYVWQRCYYTTAWSSWQMICGGTKKITLNTYTNVSFNRYCVSRQGDVVTLYANLKSSNDINAGTNTQFASINAAFAPTNSVATTGIQGSMGTCVCWIKNDGGIWVRPGSAYSANVVIEFNLTWNITAEFTTPT